MLNTNPMNIKDSEAIAAKLEAEITSRDYYYETLEGVKDMELAKIVIVSERTGLKKLLLELTKVAAE
jgi:hypothetical protein